LPSAPKAGTSERSPFASANSLFGLTRLSVWWLRLGIDIGRIKPGNPQQNGRRERMHLTLKQDAPKPASKNFLQQQARFDQFISVFNGQRPHEALNMRYPVSSTLPPRVPIAAYQIWNIPSMITPSRLPAVAGSVWDR